MRLVAVIVAIAACIASAAIAQEQASEQRPRLRYERRDDSATTRYYPRAARQQNVAGAAVVCCSVNEQRGLDCTAAFEWPQEFGFGEATVRLAEDLRLTEESYAALRQSGQTRVRHWVRWELTGQRTPELEAAFRRIGQASLDMCNEPESIG